MNTPRRWLPAITENFNRRTVSFNRRTAALAVAGLALAGSAIASPAVLAANPAGPAGRAVAAGDRGADRVRGGPDRSVRHDYQAQPNFYYCGPAATRIALSAMGHQVSQDDLARQLGTTEAGTDSAADVTRVLNEQLGRDAYRTVSIPGDRAMAATPAEMDQLQADAVRALDDNRPVVVNIIGTATDADGITHSFPGGHYLTVVGYRDEGRTLQIADPADVNGFDSYWMSTIDLANWSATRGYSA